MDFTKFEEQVFLVTVRIENLTDNEVGTGFLIKKPIKEGFEQILLFSNKHVFWGKKDILKQGIAKDLRITMHRKDAEESSALGSTHTFLFKLERDNLGYCEHPDENVDVACLNISALANVGIPLHYKAIDIENFFNFERSDIVSAEKIIFVGYPTGFYDQVNFLPILRTGTIASIPSVNFNGKSQILIDAQVFPGSSGSPVFVPINGRYKLLGIISEAFYKGLDFVEIESTNQPETEKIKIPTQWIGLGLLYTSEILQTVYDLVVYKEE
jgi:Trypsin-like peptidase domain